MGKPIDLQYAEVYHRMGIAWELKHPCYGKNMTFDFPDFSHSMGFVAFSHPVGNLWGKPMHFPNAKVYHKMGIRWKKSTHTMGIV